MDAVTLHKSYSASKARKREDVFCGPFERSSLINDAPHPSILTSQGYLNIGAAFPPMIRERLRLNLGDVPAGKSLPSPSLLVTRKREDVFCGPFERSSLINDAPHPSILTSQGYLNIGAAFPPMMRERLRLNLGDVPAGKSLPSPSLL
uniref:Uncharacterized protein n=1 Tax=Romanomermis culicivorax TaxID=13658 RepID=A0A915JXK5_ROMCU